ncbi:unnamed protein product, partial [Staurois parvus]
GQGIGSSGWTAGIGHQASAGTGSSGAGSSGSTAGIGSPGMTARALGQQALDCLARQRAPRHLARQWHRVTRHDSGALSKLARQRAPGHQVPDRLARQQRHRVMWRWIVWLE